MAVLKVCFYQGLAASLKLSERRAPYLNVMHHKVMGTRHVGQVKSFKKDQGYGFIQAVGETENFFHVSQIQENWIPTKGERVTYELAPGRDGRLQAVSVAFLASDDTHNMEDAAVSGKPAKKYHGEPTYRYTYQENKKYISPRDAITGGALLGLLIGYFLLDGGWFLNILCSAVVSGLSYWYAKDLSPGEYVKGDEITSTCLKCGGIGQVTAQDGAYYGFQCPKCRSFWQKRANNV